MADAKRKLPVVYVVMDAHFENGFAAMAFTDPDRANRWAKGARAYAGKYEPAVPRCRTCSWFRDASHSPEPPHAWCENIGRTIPTDGSGYCHEHPEATRG